MADLNYFNDRMRLVDPTADIEVNDPELDPLYKQVEKAILGGLINQKTKKKLPPNIPEAEIFPEKWRLYDRDVTAVKPSTKTGGKFVGKDFAQFKLDEREKEILKVFLGQKNKMPSPTTYNPLFDLLEEGITIPNFDRYLERSVIQDKEDALFNGLEDVLDFDLAPKPKKQQDIKFHKMEGREEKIKKDGLEDEMILEKEYKQVEKKQPMLVNIKKQQERKPFVKEPEVDEIGAQDINLEVNRDLVEKKPVNLTNIGKTTGRQQKEQDLKIVENLGQEPTIPQVKVDVTKPRIKTQAILKARIGDKQDVTHPENPDYIPPKQ